MELFIISDNSQEEHIGFFPLENFSMLSFSAVLEPFPMANQLNVNSLYKWHIYGVNDQSVMTSNGIFYANASDE